MKKPDEPNPNATIQLDSMKADDVQLVDNEAADAPASSPSSSEAARPKTTPPPLPPEASIPPPSFPPPQRPASVPAAPPKKTRNPLVIGALFAVLLVVAITVGVKVGHALRGQPPVASAAPSASTTASAATEPHRTLTMPTIEMLDEPDAH
jgi:hypothetical protein